MAAAGAPLPGTGLINQAVNEFERHHPGQLAKVARGSGPEATMIVRVMEATAQLMAD